MIRGMYFMQNYQLWVLLISPMAATNERSARERSLFWVSIRKALIMRLEHNFSIDCSSTWLGWFLAWSASYVKILHSSIETRTERCSLLLIISRISENCWCCTKHSGKNSAILFRQNAALNCTSSLLSSSSRMNSTRAFTVADCILWVSDPSSSVQKALRLACRCFQFWWLILAATNSRTRLKIWSAHIIPIL